MINGVASTGKGNLVRKVTGYEQKKLKPRSPASGSRAARAELPAAIRAYQGPTDSSEEALFPSFTSRDISALHGPHQVAQMFTSTILPR